MGRRAGPARATFLSGLVSLPYLYPIIRSSCDGFASNSVGGFSSRKKVLNVVGDQRDLPEQH